MPEAAAGVIAPRPLQIPIDELILEADLALPERARGLVVFAHGSGSSRLSPRNRHVAAVLNAGRLATVLADLLTPEEAQADERTSHLRFDIELLTRRLVAIIDFASRHAAVGALPIGCFGASTGAAAALWAAAQRAQIVRAVVSRGGRPDMAEPVLPQVQAATLLIVGGNDAPVIELNEKALAQLRCERHLEIVPGASHLFEEPGTLDVVARLACEWFVRHLPA